MPASDTRRRLVQAARDLVLTGTALPSVGAVAARAGVSRLTVYHHFGSRAGLLEALQAGARPASRSAPAGKLPVERLRDAISAACERWASDPVLFRRLPGAARDDTDHAHELASALAGADGLRPGCSLREAEDVISLATSFAAFDRLHRDGRRSPAAVAEILGRVASTVLP